MMGGSVLSLRIVMARGLAAAVLLVAAWSLAACSNLPTGGPAAQAPVATTPAPVAPPPVITPAPAPPVTAEPPAPVPPALIPPPGVARAARVALLVPLSGREAAIGTAILEGAQLALFEAAGPDFELRPYDTPADPEVAMVAVRRAIEEGADLLLGPVFRGATAATADIARQANVPMISFTNDRGVAGDGVYAFGLLPGEQVARVVAHAVSQGRRRLAALAPDDALGRLAVEAMVEAAQRLGAEVSRVAYYTPGQDLQGPARQTAAARATYDALFLPEGGQPLRSLVPLLAFHDLDPKVTKLMGMADWIDPSFAAEPNMLGAWFAAPSPEAPARLGFIERFRAAYGKAPPPFAHLGYDATAMAAVLADLAVEGGAPFGAARLTQPSGFAGTDGVFRLRPDGATERLLAILEVARPRARVIDPARDSFEALIN